MQNLPRGNCRLPRGVVSGKLAQPGDPATTKTSGDGGGDNEVPSSWMRTTLATGSCGNACNVVHIPRPVAQAGSPGLIVSWAVKRAGVSPSPGQGLNIMHLARTDPLEVSISGVRHEGLRLWNSEIHRC